MGLRFIPTHVGNTGMRMLCYRGITVHPHACGEHSRDKDDTVIKRGSSPRMWGTLSRAGVQDVDGRFIPTHVGNTRNDRHMTRTRPVHPHACGEHECSPAVVGRLGGSSPRMWGTHAFLSASKTSAIGSSPRMWGTPFPLSLLVFPFRFIPTHVGNTAQHHLSRGMRPVHPHACGEHGAHLISLSRLCGSSPRMWGTLSRAGVEDVDRRFIPTHVGNT